MCATTIPRNVKLAEAPSYGKPAILYDLRSRGAEAYLALAKEIMRQRAAEPQAPSQDVGQPAEKEAGLGEIPTLWDIPQ